jgi:hypothetical protein
MQETEDLRHPASVDVAFDDTDKLQLLILVKSYGD